MGQAIAHGGRGRAAQDPGRRRLWRLRSRDHGGRGAQPGRARRYVVVTSATQQAIDAVWRIESARLIAGLARMVRDVGPAEEPAQDAPVAALERWPADGVPANPGAWLMATAKRRAIDRLRRARVIERSHEQLGAGAGEAAG